MSIWTSRHKLSPHLYLSVLLYRCTTSHFWRTSTAKTVCYKQRNNSNGSCIWKLSKWKKLTKLSQFISFHLKSWPIITTSCTHTHTHTHTHTNTHTHTHTYTHARMNQHLNVNFQAHMSVCDSVYNHVCQTHKPYSLCFTSPGRYLQLPFRFSPLGFMQALTPWLWEHSWTSAPPGPPSALWVLYGVLMGSCRHDGTGPMLCHGTCTNADMTIVSLRILCHLQVGGVSNRQVWSQNYWNTIVRSLQLLHPSHVARLAQWVEISFPSSGSFSTSVSPADVRSTTPLHNWNSFQEKGWFCKHGFFIDFYHY